MIVVKAVDGKVTRQELPYRGHPYPGVLRPIDHETVPLLGDRLHGLPVAEPADIGEIRGHHLMLTHKLLNRWHPWMIGKRQGDVMGAQQVKHAASDPPTVADLHGKLESLGQLIEHRLQTIQKCLCIRKVTLREVGELKEQRTQL